MEKKHVLIAGTGRAGTTFLVELLTALGLDTGYKKDEISSLKNKIANAGLEKSLLESDLPFIVKDPNFHMYCDDYLTTNADKIGHCILPIRKMDNVVESRRSVHKKNIATLSFFQRAIFALKTIKAGWYSNVATWEGGVVGTSRPDVMKALFNETFFKVVIALVAHNVPITFIKFPDFLDQPEIVYEKLSFLLDDLPYEEFEKIFYTVKKYEKSAP